MHSKACTQPSPLFSRDARRIPSGGLLKANQGPELSSRRKTPGTKAQAFLKMTWHDSRRKTPGTKAQAFLKLTWHDLSSSVLHALNAKAMLPRLPSALRKRRATIKRKSYGLLLSVQQSLLDKGSTATINLLLPLRCWELHSQEVGRKVRRLASLRITGFLYSAPCFQSASC